MSPRLLSFYNQVTKSIESVPWYYSVSIVVAAFIVGFIVKRRYLSPLRRFPGPFWASVTRWWLVREIFLGKHEKNMLRLHAKYGPIVRISPWEVAISDPDAIKTIYGHASGFTKSDWYLSWSNTAGSRGIFSESDEKIHASRRRNVANAYSMSTLVHMEEFVDSCSTQILKQFERLAGTGPVNLGEWLQMYAFDVVGELAFGRKFGFLEEARDIGWISLLERLLLGNTWTGEVPYVLPLIRMPLFQNLIPSFRQQSADLQKFGQFAKNCVNARVDKGSGDRKDMLTYIIESHHKRPESYTERDVMGDAYSIVFAGSDTTAIALRSIFYHLLKNIQVYERLQEEIDQADVQGKLSSSVTFAESNTLPYLLAVCKEAMRVHPSVALCMPRNTPPSGATICGEYFPAGVTVGCNPYIINRDRSVFGEDADVFRPERWLDEKRAKEMEKSFLTFGYGSRTCVGKNISLMEMQKLVPQLLRYFEFSLVDKDAEWKTINTWFIKQEGLNVYLRQRKRIDLVPVWQISGEKSV